MEDDDHVEPGQSNVFHIDRRDRVGNLLFITVAVEFSGAKISQQAIFDLSDAVVITS